MASSGDDSGLETRNERVESFGAQRTEDNVWRLNETVENEVTVDGHDGLRIGRSVGFDVREFQRPLERTIVGSETDYENWILRKVAEINAKFVVTSVGSPIDGRIRTRD